MDPEQGTLCKGASRKQIRVAGSEPSMGPLMVDMGIDSKGDKQIAVEQPRHKSRLIVGLNPVHIFGSDQPLTCRHRKIGCATLSWVWFRGGPLQSSPCQLIDGFAERDVLAARQRHCINVIINPYAKAHW
jgi:hypothetical protein